jgi:hypothetical protein
LVATDLEPAGRTALFAGATPADVIDAATSAANQLAEVVRQRHLSQRIAGRDHILIEGWQTLGTLVGTFAVKDSGIREIPWPILAALDDEPEDARSAAHTAWENHRTLLAQRDLGRVYGFSASYRAVKNGQEIGWGEGRCTRGEKTWVARDDYALASMAQTRGQSRTLSAPLRFIVKLAGFEGTSAEEVDGLAPSPAPESPFGVTVDADGDREVAGTISEMFPALDGAAFVTLVNRRFGTDHLPDAAAKMVGAIRWALGADAVRVQAQEDAPPDPDLSASRDVPPDD